MLKSLAMTLVIATSIGFSACKSNPNAVNPSNQQVVSSNSNYSKPFSSDYKPGHKCGFITKSGNPCQRQVKDGRTFCWQHENK
jgi:hypothetical protein